MYRRSQWTRIPPDELRRLAEEAQHYIPSPCKGSFMVPFPHRPKAFDDRQVAQVQLVGLLPSQQIAAHADVSIAPLVRYHVPIQTSKWCWSFSGDEWLQLKLGSVYRMDPAVLHGAVNWGSETRLHLMIDVEEAR